MHVGGLRGDSNTDISRVLLERSFGRFKLTNVVTRSSFVALLKRLDRPTTSRAR